jgi:hypothetical protein
MQSPTGLGNALTWTTFGRKVRGAVLRTAPRHASAPAPVSGLTWDFAWQVLDSNQGRHTSTVLGCLGHGPVVVPDGGDELPDIQAAAEQAGTAAAWAVQELDERVCVASLGWAGVSGGSRYPTSVLALVGTGRRSRRLG